MSWLRRNLTVATTLVACLAGFRGAARAIDFYEIQIYTTKTAPLRQLQLELHSNTVTRATGTLAKGQLDPYQIHETLEATYGVFKHLEIGQYFCTAKLDNGEYEYAGARSKVHFGIGDPETWPLAVGGNIELDYMRHAAEQNPLELELRPILEKRWKRWWVAADFTFEKPFTGPGTHQGMTFAPSGFISYQLTDWLSPTVEYYGDMGPVSSLPGAQRQQHFIVPTLNLYLMPQLELNLGVGIGVTDASNGTFLKSIIGWTF